MNEPVQGLSSNPEAQGPQALTNVIKDDPSNTVTPFIISIIGLNPPSMACLRFRVYPTPTFSASYCSRRLSGDRNAKGKRQVYRQETAVPALTSEL